MPEEASLTSKKTAYTDVKNRLYPLIILSLLSGNWRLSAGPSLAVLHPGGVPFMMTMVETAETKEIKDTTKKAVRFLLTKDYAKLDELAATLRGSKECWSTGHCKFANVYAGLVVSAKESDAAWEARLAALRDWAYSR